MARTPEYKTLRALVRRLHQAGYQPVLVGALALVAYGSSRVTFDTDLLAARPRNLDEAKALMAAAAAAGFVYVTKFDQDGNPVTWLDVPNVAAARLTIEAPDTCFLWNRQTRMRVDLLLGFPIPASEVLVDAKELPLGGSVVLPVASLSKLAVLKEIAIRDRNRPEDAQDLSFIRTKLSATDASD